MLLVGHQWPDLSSLDSLSTAADSRQSNSWTAESYADELGRIRKTQLDGLTGTAAASIKGKFELAEAVSREVAERNRAKSDAYRSALSAVRQLRDDLAIIAIEGETRIQDVLASHDPLPLKITRILDIVVQGQSQANITAARHSNNVIDAIQRILDAEELGTSARHFAAENGALLTGAFASSNAEQLKSQVEAMANTSTKPPLAPATSDTSVDKSTAESAEPSHAFTDWGVDQTDPMTTTNRPTLQSAEIVSWGSSSSSDLQDTATQTFKGASPIDSAIEYGESTSVAAPVQPPTTNVLSTPAASTAQATVGSPSQMTKLSPQSAISLSTAGNDLLTSNTPSPAMPSAAPGDQPISPHFEAPPTHPLATQFNNGAHAGAPLSAGAEAIVSTATSFHAPLTPAPALPAEVPFTATAPTLFETAHAAPLGGESPLSAVPAEAAHPVVAPAAAAMPTAPASPPLITPVTPSVPPPAGLIGYGADLRPAVATPPPAPVAPGTVPGSAPVTPAGGSTGLGQSAVVRQPQGTAAPSNPAPAVLTENAIAATTAGAAAGASTARAQAEHRLTRLLHSAARQQPRLRWIIGERQDGSTVLATDLAGGWIPPHIDIPAAVTLLSPAVRSESLQRLVLPAELTCIYRPGDHLSADEAKPVPASIRARDTPAVIDLAWELAQATKWRDGLPRLAHTLVKAVFAGTGYLDTEVDLLDQHLATVSDRVLKAYPDNVDRDEVANWQLLATIDALIKGHNTVANYHFAWFRTQTMTPEGEAHA